MAAITVVGSLNMDLVGLAERLPAPGETLLGSDFITTPGGKGANQAYAAARLGGDVAMLGRVGSDDYGQQMLANLQNAGCLIEGVQVVDGPSGVAVILVDQAGRNCIVVIGGANQRYTPQDFAREEIHLDGTEFVLLQLESPMDTVIAAARSARRSGAKVIVDPAPATAVLPQELLECTSVLTPNEAEACQLLGGLPSSLTADEAETIAQRLLSMGPEVVIIKMGAQGCLLAQPERHVIIPAPKVQAIDTTAAGDVFNGAFAVARADGASMEQACQFAVRAASASATKVGAQQSMPLRSEITPS